MSGTRSAFDTFDEHEVVTARRTYPNLAEEQTLREARSAPDGPQRTQSGTRRRVDRSDAVAPPPLPVAHGEREVRVESVPISPRSLVVAPPPPPEPKSYPRTLSPIVLVPSAAVILPTPEAAPDAAPDTRTGERMRVLVAVVVTVLVVAASAAAFLVGRCDLP
jgi:hypothetical protein